MIKRPDPTTPAPLNRAKQHVTAGREADLQVALEALATHQAQIDALIQRPLKEWLLEISPPHLFLSASARWALYNRLTRRQLIHLITNPHQWIELRASAPELAATLERELDQASQLKALGTPLPEDTKALQELAHFLKKRTEESPSGTTDPLASNTRGLPAPTPPSPIQVSDTIRKRFKNPFSGRF